MTETQPKTLESLFVTDEEMFKRLGIPEKVGRPVIMRFEAMRTGFPQKQALWGGRRYWPAVKEFLDRSNGLIIEAPRRKVSNE